MSSQQLKHVNELYASIKERLSKSDIDLATRRDICGEPAFGGPSSPRRSPTLKWKDQAIEEIAPFPPLESPAPWPETRPWLGSQGETYSAGLADSSEAGTGGLRRLPNSPRMTT